MKPDLDHLLTRGVSEIIVRQELQEKLRSGQKLRLKLGLDPSRPDLHVGHAVVLRKMRQLQDLGHQVVLIVGDWTAQIGDPSGRDASRQMLTAEEVQENAQTYMDQFSLVVDMERTEVCWQTEWFDDFSLADVFELTSRFTMAQMLQHETFRKRYDEGRPVSLMELLYPLLQGYDSVAMRADVEFGGTDQKFNILVGRELQAALGLPPQDVFLCPLLVGTDGRKMSKSFGNSIDLITPATEMFGQVMSLNDDVMMEYFDLVTDVPDAELETMRQALSSGEAHPMELKKRLAREIVTQFHDGAAAESAQAEFEKVFQQRQEPTDVPVFRIEKPMRLTHILAASGSTASTSEARRLIQQNAVKVDGSVVTDLSFELDPQDLPASGSMVQAGKRRFLRVQRPELQQ